MNFCIDCGCFLISKVIKLWRCQHPNENWLCLSCKEVLCSRFVNKHMLHHYQQTNHSVALSFRYWHFSFSWNLALYLKSFLTNLCLFISLLQFDNSDLSVWCFSCDAYLDAQVIQQLCPVHEMAYILKFGEAPPPRMMQHPATGNNQAEGSSFGSWDLRVKFDIYISYPM